MRVSFVTDDRGHLRQLGHMSGRSLPLEIRLDRDKSSRFNVIGSEGAGKLLVCDGVAFSFIGSEPMPNHSLLSDSDENMGRYLTNGWKRGGLPQIIWADLQVINDEVLPQHTGEKWNPYLIKKADLLSSKRQGPGVDIFQNGQDTNYPVDSWAVFHSSDVVVEVEKHFSHAAGFVSNFFLRQKLSKLGLLRAFDHARLGSDAKSGFSGFFNVFRSTKNKWARLITVHVHNQDYLNSPKFKSFIDGLGSLQATQSSRKGFQTRFSMNI